MPEKSGRKPSPPTADGDPVIPYLSLAAYDYLNI